MSASAIDRRHHCPGSNAAEKDLPDLKVEEVTDTGTRIHESLHTGDEDELELSEREIKDRIKNLEAIAVESWVDYFHIVKHDTVRETRFWIRDEKLNQIASAQPDVVYIGTDAAGNLFGLVLNYKTGFAEQTPSERNWQCRTEVLAVKNEYPPMQQIRGGVIASRLYSKLDTTDYSPSDIANAMRDLQFLLWRAEQADAPRVPGAHCRWCKARGLCPESATMALVVSKGVEFGSLKNSLDVAALIKTLTPSQLKFIYERRSLANEIIESSVQRLKTLPQEQLMLIGLKLDNGASLKPITNTKLAYERLEQVLGKPAMMEVISVARGKAAEVLCEQQQITLKAAKEKVDAILGDAITPKEGAKRLKPL